MDRKALLLCAAAIPLGLAGGYAWSVMGSASAKQAKLPKEATIALPKSPEEEPAALDQEWASRAVDDPAPAPAAAAATASTGTSVYYSGCNEVRAAGKAPLHSGDPGYRVEMDGDGDGVACEPQPAR
jgi:hypothetical protein